MYLEDELRNVKLQQLIAEMGVECPVYDGIGLRKRL